MSKGPPIPVRFEDAETRALEDLSDRTGLPVADIIRRSVRLLYLKVRDAGHAGFILDLKEIPPALTPPRKVDYSVNEDTLARTERLAGKAKKVADATAKKKQAARKHAA